MIHSLLDCIENTTNILNFGNAGENYPNTIIYLPGLDDIAINVMLR